MHNLKCIPPTEPHHLESLDSYSPESTAASPFTPTLSTGLGLVYKLPASPLSMASTPASSEDAWPAVTAAMNPPTTLSCGSNAVWTHDIQQSLNVTHSLNVQDWSGLSGYGTTPSYAHSYSSSHLPTLSNYHHVHHQQDTVPQISLSPAMSHSISVASRSMSPDEYKPGMSYSNSPAATPDTRVWYPTFSHSNDYRSLAPAPASNEVYHSMLSPTTPLIKVEEKPISLRRTNGPKRRVPAATGRVDAEFDKKTRTMDEKCKLTRTRKSNDPADLTKPQCPTCGARFSRKHNLEQHMKSHLNTESRPFPCDECPLRFKRPADKHRHWQSVSLAHIIIYYSNHCRFTPIAGPMPVTYVVNHSQGLIHCAGKSPFCYS
jgi:hypothetical protein